MSAATARLVGAPLCPNLTRSFVTIGNLALIKKLDAC